MYPKELSIVTHSLLFSLLFFNLYPQGSQATCNCDSSLHDNNVSLTKRRSPPGNFRMANFIPLTNIQPVINYHNLTELYVKVVERYQSLTVITDLMGKRINESVPPPHHHCFIPEGHSIETNSSKFRSRLTEDLCMMVGLDRALNWTIQYERENRQNQFAACLRNIKYSIQQIVEGLSNITGTSTSATVAYCESHGNTLVYTERRMSSDEESEVMYETSPLNPNDIPDSTNPTRTQLGGLDDPIISDQEITELTPSASRGEDVTGTERPTVSSSSLRCGRVSGDNQQFIYIYEVWIGMYYLQNDLLPMRDVYAIH